VNSFIYKYHHIYGSPIINQVGHTVRAVVVAKDGLSARIVVDSLRQGYIHEIRMAGVKSASGESLLHDFGYYTMNQIPAGKALAVKPSATVTQSAMPASAPAPSAAVGSAPAQSASARRGAAPAKHQTTMPADWNGVVHQTVSVQAIEGLKFSVSSFDVKPGARVKLDFANTSDMMHNVVVVRPGTGTKVGEAALKLGLDGQKLDYVPKTDDVLFNTSLLEPQKVESIYFVAPTTPGDYQFVCTFPGHYLTMQGTMRVIR
jgi:uncharacterized cupredoxin-like copper-binding protein